jgi:hypothetical protein
MVTELNLYLALNVITINKRHLESQACNISHGY